MGKIIAVCISEKRGIQKRNVHRAKLIENFGIENDAHAGDWHRQVSLLSYDRILAFKQRGAEVADGAFGENLVVEGIDFSTLPVGTLLTCGEVKLRMTQIGKECHTHCQIYQKMGECIMPTQGVFAVVEQGGWVQEGDTMDVHLPEKEASAEA
jgi:TatD DNase family protein